MTYRFLDLRKAWKYDLKFKFGEIIGECVNKTTGERLLTTRGKIHYDKNGGAHIVPAPPEL